MSWSCGALSKYSRSVLWLDFAFAAFPILGTTKLIQTQDPCQALLYRRLSGKNSGRPDRSLVAMRRIEQVVLLLQVQIVQELSFTLSERASRFAINSR